MGLLKLSFEKYSHVLKQEYLYANTGGVSVYRHTETFITQDRFEYHHIPFWSLSLCGAQKNYTSNVTV